MDDHNAKDPSKTPPALELAPTETQAVIAHGKVRLQLGETEAACQAFVKATELAPESASAHFNLASALLRAGHVSEAEGAVRRALALKPVDLESLKLLGQICLASARPVECFQAYMQALRYHPTDVETLLFLSRSYLAYGELETAQSLAECALALAPDQTPVNQLLTTIRQKRDDSSGSQPVPDTPQPASGLTTLPAWELYIRDTTAAVAAAAAPLLPEKGVLVDVGANVGAFTAHLVQQKHCRAYLFEPVPLYADYARQKFAGQSQVTIENFALGGEVGTLDLWFDRENLGWNTLVSEKSTPGMGKITVQVRPFDDYAEQLGLDHIDVIKIDVEGAEYQVLQGMRRTLARLQPKPYLLIEVGWGAQDHPHWEKEVEAFEWLFAHGYERFDYQRILETTDVLVKPQSRPEPSNLPAASP